MLASLQVPTLFLLHLASNSTLPLWYFSGNTECRCCHVHFVTPCFLTQKVQASFPRGYGVWVLLPMGLLQLPLPNLLSVIYQFSCCIMLPWFMLMVPRFATPSPCSTHSTDTCGPCALAGTKCLCPYTHLGSLLWIGGRGDESVLQDSVQGFPPQVAVSDPP